MHVLIAPNAFKNSLDAIEVAAAIGAGLNASRFSGTWTSCPVGDGGDGTAALLMAHHRADVHRAVVHDPLGRPIEVSFGTIESGTVAIIEMADASGLRLLSLDELDPLRATSIGTGELILRALDAGVAQIILGIGGSATVDGAAGLLHALGVRFLDARGTVLAPSPDALTALSSIDLSALHPAAQRCRFTVLCDVNNPLLGERGAARIFGPQKGATPAAVGVLESSLKRLADAILHSTARDVSSIERGGAAGGMAAGLHGILGADLEDGIEFFLNAVDFSAALSAADVVITGEGSIDAQTADGKGPWGVARRAKRHGALVIGLAGRVPDESNDELRSCFDVLLPIGNGPASLADSMRSTAANLRRTALELGNLLAAL